MLKLGTFFKLRKLLIIKEWAMQDLNLRLLPCEGSTLATELIARKFIINHNSFDVKTLGF